KREFGPACRTYVRAFAVLRWNPDTSMHYKTTVVCQMRTNIKNMCQTFLRDCGGQLDGNRSGLDSAAVKVMLG
ncbi:hypothetical protein FIBSPDRAFT_734023, partial [Athelia psychrophila]